MTISSILFKYNYVVNTWLNLEDCWCLFKRTGYITNPTYHQILHHPLLEVYQIRNHNNHIVAWLIKTELIGWSPVPFLLHFRTKKSKPTKVLFLEDILKIFESETSILITYKV